MTQGQDLLEKMALPFYSHCQAKISPPIHSIAWNKLALSGYLDIALLLKDIDPPGSYLRKIRAFYESYETADSINPLLGDLDALSRNLTHLDKTNNKAVVSFALRWNSVVQALENFCFEMISRHKINNSDQLAEVLQSFLFNIQEGNTLPRWVELLEQQQLELSKMIQLKNLPPAALGKVNFKHQFSGHFHTEQHWLNNLVNSDKDLQDLIYVLNKNFLRLVNLMNEKIPEPERQLKANPSLSVSTPPSRDYRFTLNYFYDGNDEGEYQSNFFTLLRNFLK